MVDLTKKPFYLSAEDIAWVEQTIAAMTPDEKIGQLFTVLTLDRRPESIRNIVETYHVGGVRWQGGTPEDVWEQNRLYQELSKVPVLIASNCESGGNGAVGAGTLVASAAACGAAPDDETAYLVGKVSGAEAEAIGSNWMFAPISDVFFNWRNTIVNTRSYGSDVDKVIACCKAYMRGIREKNIACCTKHFPGDGSEERDQHLLLGCNDLSCEEWDASYGRVYQALIDEGIEGFMIGHICQPAYSRRFRPGLTDKEIMPATLSPELLQDLLRGQLGFNGIIITDASHMGGLTSACSRREQMIGAVAAGCDMILFFNDPEEDIQYIREGIETGRITAERLSDALHRILGLKAKLGLHHLQYPSRELLPVVGCEAHHALAAKAADAAVTLVKDTQNLLPIDPAQKKRALLFYVQSAPASPNAPLDEAKQIVVDELTKAGFEVDVYKDAYEQMKDGSYRGFASTTLPHFKKNELFRAAYDVVFVFIHMKGYAQENNVRLSWDASHSVQIPWYTTEVPTVFVSLNYTNHLYDVPMAKTFVNAYAPTREYIHAAVEKLTGQSAFRGTADETVFCGRWDTRR